MTERTLAATQTLIAAALDHAGKAGLKPLAVAVLDSRGAMKGFAAQEGTSLKRGEEIGRASCRERVWQYVYISVVAVSFKKKTERRIRTGAESQCSRLRNKHP